MSRYIDADALIEKFKVEHDWSSVYIVEDMPASDVVEVVRCKDCVYYRCLTIMGSMPRMMCSVFNWQSTEDDFCSFAEMRGDIT